MKNWKLEIINYKTDNLTDMDFKSISNVEREMWAYSIGEYVRCSICDIIFSKKDIYWNKFDNISKKTILEFEDILSIEYINCNLCNSKSLKYIYDTETNILNV